MVALGPEHGWVGIPPTHLRLRDVDHFNPALRILARGCSEPRGAQTRVLALYKALLPVSDLFTNWDGLFLNQACSLPVSIMRKRGLSAPAMSSELVIGSHKFSSVACPDSCVSTIPGVPNRRI